MKPWKRHVLTTYAVCKHCWLIRYKTDMGPVLSTAAADQNFVWICKQHQDLTGSVVIFRTKIIWSWPEFGLVWCGYLNAANILLLKRRGPLNLLSLHCMRVIIMHTKCVCKHCYLISAHHLTFKWYFKTRKFNHLQKLYVLIYQLFNRQNYYINHRNWDLTFWTLTCNKQQKFFY